METLFKAHITNKLQQVGRVLEKYGYDSLIIDAGAQIYYFLDDQPMPFKSNPYFSLFCPDSGPQHLLQIQSGKKPKLAYYSPNDFWHETAHLGNPFWASEFEISEVQNFEDLWKSLDTSQGKHCVLTPNPEVAVDQGFDLVNDSMLAALDWTRVEKTDYEVSCIKEANRIASLGHMVAKEAFFAGESERKIQQRYLSAVELFEHELPYPNIIALNERAAFLHYHGARNVGQGRVMLIDAGATHNHYCSDITRTYFIEDVPQTFKDLHVGLEKIQQNLCVQVIPGIKYAELHNQANRNIGQLLLDLDIIQNITLEQAVEQQLIGAFFPHGLGHPLGLQVHDVAGKQIDEEGSQGAIDSRYPHLRTLREIHNNDVLTIEPGCYFIPMLLDPLRADNNLKDNLNWKIIDELIHYGGIRIEDDVHASPSGPVNLTRPFIN